MNNVADFLSFVENNWYEKIFLKICGDVPTQPIEVNIESTGTTQKNQVPFNTDDMPLPSEEDLWLKKP